MKVKRAVRMVIAPGTVAARDLAIERDRLASMPRYVETMTSLSGVVLKIPDGPSFMASWKEIFDQEIYRFRTTSAAPRILDCGANIGVSCLFFKKNYPQARVTAFEPDPQIFACLQHNLRSSGITDIECISKGVWNSETTLFFHPDGADGGRIEVAGQSAGVEIKTVRLFDYLNEPVDFLKIDIEGAETEVLLDIAPRLDKVRNLFVEYHSFARYPQTLDQLLLVLKQSGFRVQIQPVRYAPRPFLKVEEALGMDMQLNLFAYRE